MCALMGFTETNNWGSVNVIWFCHFIACDEACTTCFDGSNRECYSCAESLGYILADTECITPFCVPGLYFDWDLLRCKNCHYSCYTCSDGSPFNCTSCPLGALFDKNLNICKKCDEYTGLYTSEEHLCDEVCGDGYWAGLLPCDDGNTISGDGCSGTCQIEYGFGC